MGENVERDLSDLRREYRNRPLNRGDLDPDPVRQFDAWFHEALETEGHDANAMSVSTVGPEGQPSVRMVLLKYYGPDGFVFYTNLGSRKAGEIGANPRVALLFHWAGLNRQVKILGRAERTAALEDARYFMRRPRESQLGAWVSRQSSVISARAVLEGKLAEMRARFADGEVPLPSFWGGFRVRASSIEFWQGRESRLHDRFRYEHVAGHWDVSRLAP